MSMEGQKGSFNNAWTRKGRKGTRCPARIVHAREGGGFKMPYARETCFSAQSKHSFANKNSALTVVVVVTMGPGSSSG